MAANDSLWYRLGESLPGLGGGLRRLAPDDDGRTLGLVLAGAAAAAGLGAVVVRALSSGEEPEPVPPTRKPSGARWIRGAGAGVAATAAELVVQALLRAEGGEDPATILEQLLEGAGDGLVYASLVGSRPPLPPALTGAAYGLADFAAGPWGGVSGALLAILPRGYFPTPARALTGRGRRGTGDVYEHLVFGVVLALIYGSGRGGE